MPEVKLTPVEVIQAAILRAGAAALHDVGEDVLGRSVRRAPIAPEAYKVDGVLQQPGRLRASGTISPEVGAELAGDRLEVEIAFTMPYAAAQHEGLDFNHPAGGEAKYLERSLQEIAPKVEGFIGHRVRDELRQVLR